MGVLLLMAIALAIHPAAAADDTVLQLQIQADPLGDDLDADIDAGGLIGGLIKRAEAQANQF